MGLLDSFDCFQVLGCPLPNVGKVGLFLSFSLPALSV